MERVPPQKYTTEFREQAVQLILEQKLTIPEAARRLSMSDKTLKNWVGRARRGQLATLGPSRRPVTELEAEVSRLTRELVEARMERDILKKAPRTLRRRSCPVRAHKHAACPVSVESVVLSAGGVSKQLLCLVHPSAFETRPGERAAGSRDPGRPCADLADVWPGTAPSRTAGGRVSSWDRPDQAAAEEAGVALHPGTPVHHHHGFGASPASGGERLGANICRDTTERDLGH